MVPLRSTNYSPISENNPGRRMYSTYIGKNEATAMQNHYVAVHHTNAQDMGREESPELPLDRSSKSSRATSISLVAEDSNDNLPGKEFLERGSSQTLLRDSISQILFSCLVFLSPLMLSAVLMYLVYKNLIPINQDYEPTYSIMENNQSRPVKSTEYYVAYSATRLVFISSLSSTLALGLVPVGMALFAYCPASALYKASLRKEYSLLPSPIQFELCIRLLEGSAVGIYRYLRYLLRPVSDRVPTVPALHQSAVMLAALFSLAFFITVVDSLFHIKMSAVQFTQITPSAHSNFLPGRRLPSNCTDLDGWACNIIWPSNTPSNYTTYKVAGLAEGYRVLSNSSDRTSIGLVDDGITSVIIPVSAPSNTEFSARSFGSATVCETVTRRCDPHYSKISNNTAGLWSYDCEVTNAGMQMSGTFSRAQPGVSNWTFFAGPSKTIEAPDEGGNAVNGSIWQGMQAFLPFGDFNNAEFILNSMGYDPNYDVAISSSGDAFGIFSCNTTLLNVAYLMSIDGTISNAIVSPMDSTTSEPFYQAYNSAALASLNSGLDSASVTSRTGKEMAYQFARTIDRTVLSLTAGILEEEGAFYSETASIRQVAKVPILEFVALVVLNSLVTTFGILLTLAALYLRTDPGVVDIQARLDIGALVATLFDEKKLNETATSVKDMYAESRGLRTSRIIATDGNNEGGRGFVAFHPLKAS